MPESTGAAPRPESFFLRAWRRRWVRWTAIAIAVLAPAGALGGRAGWTYIKTDPSFCTSCHLMKAPAEAWRHSAHKDVACQTCHRADIFEEMALGYAAFIEGAETVRPHTKLDIRICEECHVSNDARWKQIAKTPGHRVHFAQREIDCYACHVRGVHEFKADTEQCLRCHGKDHLKLEKMETLHCLGCHDFLGKKANKASANGPIPQASSCRACHPAEPASPAAATAAASPLPGKAAPVTRGHENSLGCHRPHGKPLEDPIDCIACHRGVLSSTSKHYKDERLEACRDCHKPHEAR